MHQVGLTNHFILRMHGHTNIKNINNGFLQVDVKSLSSTEILNSDLTVFNKIFVSVLKTLYLIWTPVTVDCFSYTSRTFSGCPLDSFHMWQYNVLKHGERIPTRCNNIDIYCQFRCLILTTVWTCFGLLYAHQQEKKTTCYCIWGCLLQQEKMWILAMLSFLG